MSTAHAFADKSICITGGGEFTVRSYPSDRKRIDIGDYYADTRIRKALGWQPRVSLREGLDRTLAYYRGNLLHYI